MSWWDYGYHIAEMANRTVTVDNNTHIATVGKVFASTEEEGYSIARFIRVDYVLLSSKN
jgi:dolichyl-diphosphooligosaccharide--protein glycosyltransferase